jgi:hypothetical protein
MSGFRLPPEVETELDDIWLYIAKASSSIDIANRLLDQITDRLWLLSQHPQLAEDGTIFGQACEVPRSGST